MTLPEKPFSRKEQYLAKIAGEDTEIPEKPFSREEMYLDAIAQGGGGGGGYVLPIASADELGGVKVGTGLAIDADTGVLSTSGGSGPTVVQTTGTSTTDVMSQDASTKLIFKTIAANQKVIAVGNQTPDNYAFGSVGLGCQYQRGQNNVLIGNGVSGSTGNGSGVAVGYYATLTNAGGDGAVALGAFSKPTRAGEVNVGSVGYASSGYNNTEYRVIGGVHDGVDAHDAVTLGQISALITAINSALGTSIILASDGSITNANSGNNSGNNAADPGDNGGGVSDEPAPEDEPGPE